MKVNLEELGMSDEQLFSKIDHNDLESEKITAPRYSYWQSVFRVFFKKKINTVILILFFIIIAFAYIYPLCIDFDRYANLMDSTAKHLTPAKAIEKFGLSIHTILGQGASGESTFDSMWYGSRISISLAFVCGVINMTLGVLVGAIWGFSKKIDAFMNEVRNVVGNIPYILIISVLVLAFTPSFWTMVFAMTCTGWIFIAYFIRTQVIIIRDREYNLASKCLGTSTIKIAMKNILPFMTSVIVTQLAVEIPSYISYEVFLSYIGLGLADNSLGKIIYAAQTAMVTPGWEFEFWSPVALASFITIVLYVVGQNLGDASDPRTHM